MIDLALVLWHTTPAMCVGSVMLALAVMVFAALRIGVALEEGET